MEIRPANQSDTSEIRILLHQLGYDIPIDEMGQRLAALSEQTSDAVLLAVERKQICGLIAIHWTQMLHLAKPMARIVTLIVREDARKKGIGRRLVEAGSELVKRQGCGWLELTTGMHRTEAHAFYEAMGFKATSLKFRRSLNEPLSAAELASGE
jgi:GNAT superfamily N-acetyltransferase